MLPRIVSKLWTERRYIAIAAAASAVLGLAVSFLVPPRFTSTVRIIPPQQVQSSLAALLGQLGAIGFTGLMSLRNPSDVYVHLIRSESVALALNQRFALDKHYGVEKFEDVQRKLENRTEARAGRDGVVMVRVTDRDAKVAAALANGYVEELHNLVQRLAEDEKAQRKRFIEGQVRDAKKSLEHAEAEFRKLQEAVGAVQLGHVESAYATMGGLRASIMSREVALRTLALSSTTQNPLYRTIEAEIKALRAQLEKLEQDPQVQNPKFVIPADRAPELTLEYLRKLRDLRFEEAMYQAVLRQYELVRMEDSRDFQQFLIVDSARPATKRDFPQQWMVALFVMLMGLGAAIYAALTDQLVYPSDFWRKPDNAQPKDPLEL